MLKFLAFQIPLPIVISIIKDLTFYFVSSLEFREMMFQFNLIRLYAEIWVPICWERSIFYESFSWWATYL